MMAVAVGELVPHRRRNATVAPPLVASHLQEAEPYLRISLVTIRLTRDRREEMTRPRKAVQK